MFATKEMLNPFGSMEEWDYYANLARRESFVPGVPDHFIRNLGFNDVDEQIKLQDAKISISGGGGDGGQMAILSARTGLGCGPNGFIRLADPEVFGVENSNRQAGCNALTIGQNKAISVAKEIIKIYPAANVEVYTEGITPDNLEGFLKGADLVADEAAYEKHELAVMTNRVAREMGIPVVQGMNLGWGAIVTTMHPQGEKFEKQLGFNADDLLEPTSDGSIKIDDIILNAIAGSHVPVKHWAPYLPYGYGDYDVLDQVASGLKPAPSIAEGMAVTAARTVLEMKLNVWNGANKRKMPTYFRKARIFDIYADVAKTVNYNDFSYYAHGMRALVRSKMLRMNPETDFDLHPGAGANDIEWPAFSPDK